MNDIEGICVTLYPFSHAENENFVEIIRIHS